MLTFYSNPYQYAPCIYVFHTHRVQLLHICLQRLHILIMHRSLVLLLKFSAASWARVRLNYTPIA